MNYYHEYPDNLSGKEIVERVASELTLDVLNVIRWERSSAEIWIREVVEEAYNQLTPEEMEILRQQQAEAQNIFTEFAALGEFFRDGHIHYFYWMTFR